MNLTLIRQEITAYARQFVGTPYIWGGDDPINGYDCSGLVQELLASVGLDPSGDQTADALAKHFSKESLPEAGNLVFWPKEGRKTHVAILINCDQVIEAGGGGSRTKTQADAIRDNGYIRIRPLNYRGSNYTVRSLL